MGKEYTPGDSILSSPAVTRGSEEIASKELLIALSMGTRDCCAKTDEWSKLSSAVKLRARNIVFFFKDNSNLIKYSHTKP